MSHGTKREPVFKRGDRVQAHPATDVWMMGDRWGSVASVGRKYVHVDMDRSGRRRRFLVCNLLDEHGNVRVRVC